MKTTYETFGELADAMCLGEGKLHRSNCPGVAGCVDWQSGVCDFAEWLDHIGLKVEITDGAKDFYDFIRDKEMTPISDRSAE